MSRHDYPWKRFWVAREGNLVLTDEGYLEDPEAEYGNLTNPRAVLFSSIEYLKCLVLLGEPGIGKSKALKDTLSSIEQTAKTSGDKVIFLNLNAYSSEDRLVRDIFEAEAFLEWTQATGDMHLILDSLDECLLRIDTVANILGQKLNALPQDRLNLRIACRTAVWPSGLEEAIQALWGSDNVGIYEMAPLRRGDIALAASQEGLDSSKFLSAVDDRNAGSLAAKPITLSFLLNTFRRDGGFPQSQSQLFQEGCRLLCEESNDSRLVANRTGTLSTDQQLLVASRIAGCTVFGNHAGVWIGPDGHVPSSGVRVRHPVNVV